MKILLSNNYKPKPDCGEVLSAEDGENGQHHTVGIRRRTIILSRICLAETDAVSEMLSYIDAHATRKLVNSI